MKIAIWYNLISGGAKRCLYHQVEGLLRSGHHVEVWCPPSAARDFIPLQSIVPEHVVPLEYQLNEQKGLFSAASKLMRKRQLFRALEKHSRICAGQINNGGYDILLAHPCFFMSAPYIGRYISIPKALYLQEPNRKLYEAFPTFQWMARPSWKSGKATTSYLHDGIQDIIRHHFLRIQAREEFLNATTYDRILVNSYFSRESVLRAYGLDSTVCYLGVDTDYFKPDRSVKKENAVCTVGAIYPGKNLQFIIRAMSYIKEPKPKLLCIGNYLDVEYKAMLEKLAVDSRVKVEFLFNISDADMQRYINRSRVFLYSARLEPFGLTPLEANSCGLPVIGVMEGGIKETIVSDVNGIIVEPNPERMAEALQRMLDHPRKTAALGKSARGYVKNTWSLKAATERLEKQLIDTIKQRQ